MVVRVSQKATPRLRGGVQRFKVVDPPNGAKKFFFPPFGDGATVQVAKEHGSRHLRSCCMFSGKQLRRPVRTVREVLGDVKRVREDFAGHLAKLEADGQGNTDLAWRFRDYITAADKVIAAVSPADRP